MLSSMLNPYLQVSVLTATPHHHQNPDVKVSAEISNLADKLHGPK